MKMLSRIFLLSSSVPASSLMIRRTMASTTTVAAWSNGIRSTPSITGEEHRLSIGTGVGTRQLLDQHHTQTALFSMTTDESAMSRSRAPFRMPGNSPDDSTLTKAKGVKQQTWNELGLWQELLDKLADLKFAAPTPVQAMAIPSLLQEKKKDEYGESDDPQKQSPLKGSQQYSSLAFLAATGSGKTISYVLPILQQLKQSEVFDNVERPKQRPRCIVLAPTRELVLQIKSVIKQFCHTIKLSCQSLTAGGDSSSYSDQKKALSRPIDIVVATPGQFIRHWKDGNLYISKVEHVVLDEMDTLIEQGFQKELKQILYPMLYAPDDQKKLIQLASEDHNMKITPPSLVPTAPRIILTSATMTKAIQKILGSQTDSDAVTAKKLYSKQPKQSLVLPSIPVMKAPGLHKAVPRLEQIFIDVGNVDKISLLVDVVASSQGRATGGRAAGHVGGTRAMDVTAETDQRPLTMVFCNTAASCRAVQFALAEARLNSLSYHGELNSIIRSENLRRFRFAHENADSNQPRVLVCTDLAARGIDIPEVDHVIMFDFPLNSLDYIHRSGRTARGDRTSGKVTCLITKRDKVLATAIESAVQRGEPLDGLSSRKSDYLPGGRLNRRSKNTTNKRTPQKFSVKKKKSKARRS